MKIRLILISLLLLAILPATAMAQEGGVKGNVISRAYRANINGVKVTLSGAGIRTVYTDRGGKFEFQNVAEGSYTLLFEAVDFQAVQINVNITDFVQDLGYVSLPSEAFAENIDESEFAEFDMESGDAQSMPVVLTASKDIFDNIAGYKFSDMRFRIRGYDSGMTDVYLNGVYLNDAMTGYTPWSLWTGLNDATRNQESTSGLAISDYGVGGIGGTTNINARASQLRQGFRASVVNANNNYRFRVMATYASGEQDNGWSYAFSASTRQGGNDWVNGVWHNSWGYFGSVEKRLGAFNRLALTFFGTPQQRSVQGAATQEAYDLVGSNYYNPNWGYQGGTAKKDQRNARIRKYHEPVAMLNYYYEPSSRFQLSAAVAFRFGRNGYSALDWYDAPDPRPDYYRNLPSYFMDQAELAASKEEKEFFTGKAGWAAEGWKSDWNIRQINWDQLYDINRNSFFEEGGNYWNNVDPSGLRRSKYIIEERRTDQRDVNAKIQVMSLVSDRSRVNAGFDFRWNRTEYFKVIKDLLGGDYYLDVDQFAERDNFTQSEIQNNLNTPNRLVKKGDKFGYDYYAHLRADRVWANYRLNLDNVEITAGLESGHTEFWREGRFRKGLFPDNSEGKSRKQHFWTYTAKIGLTYRPVANQMIYANFAALSNAPYFQKSFVSPRTRNTLVDNLKTEKILSGDINYALRLPTVRMRFSAYYTSIKDRTDIINFWSDLDRAYTNFILTGLDQKYMGVELGISAPLVAGLSAEGAFSYGYYIYSSNPLITQTVDNSESIVLQDERVYWKNFKVPSTPQTAINLGLRYRGPKNIFAGIDANFYDAMYISMAPHYRIDKSHVGLSYDDSQELARQEKFKNAFVMNANIGKSWYVNGYNIGFNLEVKNLLNYQGNKTGGYEQLRVRRVDSDTDAYERFDAKYFYMLGTTYYLNIYFRF